jgi:hypothetical protein
VPLVLTEVTQVVRHIRKQEIVLHGLRWICVPLMCIQISKTRSAQPDCLSTLLRHIRMARVMTEIVPSQNISHDIRYDFTQSTIIRLRRHRSTTSNLLHGRFNLLAKTIFLTDDVPITTSTGIELERASINKRSAI